DRILRDDLFPQSLALLAPQGPSPRLRPMCADPDLALRTFLQIEIPERVIGVPALRAHDDVGPVMIDIEKRRVPFLPRLAPPGGQQQRRDGPRNSDRR